ncbi:hypothetical protein B296_00011100 [Ensete ventricosum]|uniref:Uncharacterized protein n=1 Tax=Ensete ventricosum TaxID=4639 RepID=A0A427AZX0_ENSVE|nr:hypothetical protein B296_00011100 [Ensete ventricosum]
MKNVDFFPIKPMDYGRFLVISLGTGSNKQEERFSAEESGKYDVSWPLERWTHRWFQCHTSSRFEQDDALIGDAASVDVSTRENSEKLMEVDGNLLKPVSRVNLENGTFEACDGEGINEEALTQFAHRLSSERKLRNSC